MTAAHVTVQSGQKCNEHVSVTNMAIRDTQNILLLWKCWNSAFCLTFIVTLGRCLCSFLLLKYAVLHSHCTVCWQVLPALFGAKERSEPETDYTFNSLCLHQLGNTKLWTLWWSHFCMLHRVHKSVPSLTAATVLVSITQSSLTNPYTTLAYKYPLENTA